jgi:hypothetical protein
LCIDKYKGNETSHLIWNIEYIGADNPSQVHSRVIMIKLDPNWSNKANLYWNERRQKIMMELHRALENRSLAVSMVQGKGRSLFTTRDFYPGFILSLELVWIKIKTSITNVKMCVLHCIAGEVIISQEPYVCVPTHKRCDGCFATTNLSKCSRCQLVWYCGTPCQVFITP